MKKILFGITWAAAQNIYWLPVLCLVILFVYFAFTKKNAVIRQLVARKWLTTLFAGYSYKRSVLKSVLLYFAFVFMFLALLRPQWGKKETMVEQEGRELFIALDISRSMLVSDIKPNRLAFAKSKVKKLLRLLPSERVGLLIFSGTAVVQCPLTRDKALFNMFLNQLDADTISSGTTAIDQAILKVIQVLKKQPTHKNKILVVFTDGEDFSHNLSQVKEQAQDLGVHIFTYGVGTEQGAPIPVLNESGVPVSYEKNEQGNVILSRLNSGILKSLSKQTGARYIAPTQSDEDLQALITDVERFEKEKFEDKEFSRGEEKYPYFLAVSFVSLLVEFLL